MSVCHIGLCLTGQHALQVSEPYRSVCPTGQLCPTGQCALQVSEFYKSKYIAGQCPDRHVCPTAKPIGQCVLKSQCVLPVHVLQVSVPYRPVCPTDKPTGQCVLMLHQHVSVFWTVRVLQVSVCYRSMCLLIHLQVSVPDRLVCIRASMPYCFSYWWI